MDIRKDFGKTIRHIRLERGLSQEKLAQYSNLHRTYLSDIERGNRNVSLENIVKLANALGVTLSELFSIVEQK